MAAGNTNLTTNSSDVLHLAGDFDTMVEQLRGMLGTLQQRVVALNRDVQVASEVATTVASVLDLDALLPTLVDTVQRAFSLYHVHVYLLDDSGEQLLMAAGVGEAGRAMKQARHRIALLNPESIVARAARGRQPLRVDDVHATTAFLANPLLPHTRAELALPLVAGNTLIGVLDVQSDQVSGFSDANQQVLALLASQLSVAVQNARVFAQVRAAQEQLALTNSVVQTATIGVSIADAHQHDMPLIYVNSAFESMTGYPPAEVVGANCRFLQGDDRDQPGLTVLRQALKERTGCNVLVRNYRKDGTLFWNELTLSPLFADDGSLRYYVGLQTDVTERILAEQRATLAYELGRELSAITDAPTLLQTAVDRIAETLDYYHVHAYLLDGEARRLNLAAGVGEVGRQLREFRHVINLDAPQSLVARAARFQEPVVVQDTRAFREFLANPLLPETRAEVSLPLVAGGQVLGVLDVQQDAVGVFTEDEIRTLGVVASQLAVALANASQLAVTQQLVSELTLTTTVADTMAQPDLDLPAALDSVIALLRPSLGATTSVFSRYDAETSRWLGLTGGGEGVTRASDAQFVDPLDRYPHAVEAVRTGHSVLVNDVRAYPNFPQDIADTLGIAAVAVVPAMGADGPLGVLFFNFATPQTFSAATRGVLESMVTSLSVGVESKLLAQRTRALGALNRDLASAIDKRHVLAALGRALSHTRFDLVNMLFTNARTPHALPHAVEIMAAQDGQGHDVPLSVFPYTTLEAATFPLLQTVLDAGPDEVLVVEDMHADPRTRDDAVLRAFVDASNIRAVIGVPLVAAGEWQALVTITWSAPQVFDPETRALVRDARASLANSVASRRAFLSQRAALDAAARRARELATVADVSAIAARNLDATTLLKDVVQLAKARFGLYHAHTYLLDDNGTRLLLVAGADDPGDMMVRYGHAIDASNPSSIVALAARSLAPVYVPDVNDSEAFLPNPLLPDTQAELAVPMLVAGRLVGVLDVQADRRRAFDDDQDVFATLASLVAVAVENARAFQRQQDLAERERATAERLREVDRLKSQFLASMSHELRTPLNSIIGYSEVLLDGADGDLPDEASEDIEIIHNSGRHLLAIINDVLDLAKIEAEQMRLVTSPVDLRALLDDVVRSSQVLVGNRLIALRLELALQTPTLAIEADELRLRQVLLNLTSNALKFTERGTITLRATQPTPDHVRISVSDTGIGIASADLERVFDQFHQVDGSSTRRAGGTGLGLTITRHLVRLHHGDIHVESTLGEGTTFTVTLPVHQPTPTDPAPQEA